MKRKSTQTLLLVFSSLLLLFSVTVSAQGQPAQDQSYTPDFSGDWETVTSTGKTFALTLKATNRRTVVTGNYYGKALAGSYKPLGGSASEFVKVSALMGEPVPQNLYPNEISGTVTDNVLRFTWVERTSGSSTVPLDMKNASRGSGRFTLSSDGESFEGTFSRTSDPDDTSGGTWSGTRVHLFAGAWQGKLGEGAMELILQEDRTFFPSKIGGELHVNSANLGFITDGHVEGNTLRFTVMRTKTLGKPEYAGTGELVMDRGGKSFTGTILGAAASATLVGRPGRR